MVKSGRDEAKAKDFIARLYKNVPVLDSGARGATTTFIERGIGDVLINWENEILLAGKELGKDKFDIVVPPTSILAEPTVSWWTRWWTSAGRARWHRPIWSTSTRRRGRRSPPGTTTGRAIRDIGAKYGHAFPAVKLFTLDEVVRGTGRRPTRCTSPTAASSTRST